MSNTKQDPPSWKNTFNTSFKRWGHVSEAKHAATVCEYPYYVWNGWVYPTADFGDHARICYESALK